MRTLWGIDFGGTKIEGVVVPHDRPTTPITRLRVDTDAHRGYNAVIEACSRLVARLENETGLQRPPLIGVGTPGTIDPRTDRLRNSNTVCLNDTPFHHDLAKALRTQLVVANDANCFALAEALHGAGQGARVVFGVIIGTGVGGGIVYDGKVWPGYNGIAGEWGHNVIEPDGTDCYCGKEGCVETVISGPALERWYAAHTQDQLSLPEIVAAHRSGGNTTATQTVHRLCAGFGRGLAHVVNVLDPDCIVLGGGVGQVDELYKEGTAELARHVFHDIPTLDVRRPELGDSAGVFGAALLTATDRSK